MVSLKFNRILLLGIPVLMVFLSCNEKADFKFEKGKKLVYHSDYRDSSGQLIASEIVEMIGTGEKTHFSNRQEKIFYNFLYNPSDSAMFVNKPRLYPDFTYSLSWQKTFSQGIIQDSNRIWMHPLRANQYRFTQDSPFPEVKFPLETGKKWKRSGRSGTDFKTPVIATYEVQKRAPFKSRSGKIKDCWFISANSSFGSIKNALNMVYHEKKGFLLFSCCCCCCCCSFFAAASCSVIHFSVWLANTSGK